MSVTWLHDKQVIATRSCSVSELGHGDIARHKSLTYRCRSSRLESLYLPSQPILKPFVFMINTRRVLNVLVSLVFAVVLAVLLLQYHISRSSRPFIKTNMEELDHAYVGIVLGASVRPDKSLSPILQDRVDAALKAYEMGYIDRFLLSGDHGSADYDEVNAMKDYLNKKGVPSEVIFLDHAGFDTYDSMYRARAVFHVKEAIVFTQDFHLPRAIYLARKFGLTIQGYKSDMRVYPGESTFRKREWLANLKAWFEININKRPSYLGEAVPITGDSSLSHDK